MIPPVPISSAARKKNGIASSRYLSVPTETCCATTISGMLPWTSR